MYEIRTSSKPTLPARGLGEFQCLLFPELWTTPSPSPSAQASLQRDPHPQQDRDDKAPRSHGSPLILLQGPAPALPGGVGWGVAPSRAVQLQLLAPAEMLGAGVDLHPWHLCTGLEKGSAPRYHWLPTHGARQRLCQGPTRGRAYPGQRAIGRRWQRRGHCAPHTRTGPRPPAARG